jgi:hypothetical protein
MIELLKAMDDERQRVSSADFPTVAERTAYRKGIRWASGQLRKTLAAKGE